LQFVEHSKTPTLFMQGKEDERCPKSQSEEMFVSLMCAGDTPTELVLYPDEDHRFLGEGKPSCRSDASSRIVEWITRHACKEETDPGTAPV
jgi:dipeptidyl aminopeptidase/acylaminoacyl peptidase